MKVLLYGNSLFLAGVGAILKEHLDLDVIQVNMCLPDAEQHLLATRPDVVVFDLTAPHALRGIALLKGQPDLPLVGLNADDNTVLVLSARSYEPSTVSDLARVIRAQVGLPTAGRPDTHRGGR